MIYSERKWVFAREYTHLFNSGVVCWYIVYMLLSTSIPYIFILDKLFVVCSLSEPATVSLRIKFI